MLIMNNDLYRLVSELPNDETMDTPDQIVHQLAALNYRLDILLTIVLVAVTVLVIVGLCYMFYRFVLKFIP